METNAITSIAAVVFGLPLYVTPAVIAFVRGHGHRIPVLALNVVLGWTGLGWLAALMWAVANDAR